MLVWQHANMLQKKAAKLLIVSVSARALAQSAACGGYLPVVIDAFADTDTRQCSVYCTTVPLDYCGSFNRETLHQVFNQCIEEYGDSLIGWIAGSGFEGCTSLLEAFAKKLPLFGNTPDTFTLCTQRERIKSKASNLGLPCVPTDSTLPQLSKKSQTNGGRHITFQTQATRDTLSETYLPGTAISHLFLAADGHVETVGIGTQWHSMHDKNHPFCYGGCLNVCILDDAKSKQIEKWSTRLSADMGLCGLNNIDYLYCGGTIYFLELNPRPTASFPLYDADYPNTLLDAHIHACHKRLTPRPKRGAIRSQAVIYAPEDCVLSDSFRWGRGFCDRPTRRVFKKGEPICSVAAQGDTVESALSMLQDLTHHLLRSLDTAAQQ